LRLNSGRPGGRRGTKRTVVVSLWTEQNLFDEKRCGPIHDARVMEDARLLAAHMVVTW
jgi:hypothetical protein